MNLPRAALPFPPCVVVHGWDEARAAVRAGLPVTLLSGPGAAAYAGIGWWRALVNAVARETGEAPPDILDCGDSGGLAVQALRAGCRALVLDPSLPVWEDVADRAGTLGAVVLGARPPALDLSRPGAQRHLSDWLRSAAGDSALPFG